MQELLIYLIALPIAYLANTTGGVAVGTLQAKFDKEILKRGLIKGLFIYITIGLLVAVVYFIPDIQVNLDGTNIGVIEAMNIMLALSVGFYVVDALKKLATLFKGKQPEIDVIDEGVQEEVGVG